MDLKEVDSSVAEEVEADNLVIVKELSDGTGRNTRSWIEWYCSLHRNMYLCEIHVSFFDNFNLFGLEDVVPNFKYALGLIKGAKLC